MKSRIFCTIGIDIVSAQIKYNTISEVDLWKRSEVQETSKKRKELSAWSSHTATTNHCYLHKAKVKNHRNNLPRGNSDFGLEYLYITVLRKCSTCGTSQACTTGSTKALRLYGYLPLSKESKYSTYFPHIFLHECYQHNYETLK